MRDAELTEQITAVHTRSRATYGAPRIHAVLKNEGAGCDRRRVARLMRQAGLAGLHRDLLAGCQDFYGDLVMRYPDGAA
ncbi:IS3 family transposase [Streptomyces europaeiscabiei]|uniref:IS3 family transposase n=1 Tax=Streptomyces europaeiscabiei TaxID=146819 RepID=UPI002E2CCC29|nr:IS3 family transposase [Streptomyces europaeiscabiei]